MKLKDKLKKNADKLRVNVPAIYLSLKSTDTPIIAKIFGFLTVAYALSPIDLIPDFVPVLGYLDDLILLPALAAITLKLIPKGTLESCRKEAESIWENGKPKKWYYSIPIIVSLLVIIIVIIKIIVK